MGFIELFLVGIGLSMDAFAVAVCKGLNMRRINFKHSFIIALFFGGFQALMPFIGWAAANFFQDKMTTVDHWVAFILLIFIGGKMIYESLKENDDDSCSICEQKLNIKELLMMSIATSIDALAVGITFSFLNVNIILAITVIGITTFTLSFIGVIIGNKFGSIYKKKAEIAGGAVLVLLGIKILLEHLGIISL